MLISLNGEHREVSNDTTLGELLGQLDLGASRFAVELNEQLIPRSEHPSCTLAAGDRVEIVRAIGGG